MKNIFHLKILLVFLVFNNIILTQPNEFFIRLNQVGYLPGEFKSGVVISESKLPTNHFSVINKDENIEVYSGMIEAADKIFGKFNNNYYFDFSGLNKPGNYYIEIGNEFSNVFRVGRDVYNHVRDSLIVFFRSQRCGPTSPYLHKKCHLSDATSIIGLTPDLIVDVTGGWHDAGDYIKFFSTTAITTYLMLFSYEFDSGKFGFDNDKNDVPDILEEAKIGLDWLLRCNISDSLFVLQVQDERDHNAGWRLPENDSLQFDRPAFIGIGKNLIGIYAAVMALASRIWSDRFSDNDFANCCLTTAIQKYSICPDGTDLINDQTDYYKDKVYYGKMALGAIELFITTSDEKYLTDAVNFGDSARGDFWWSWGDINSLAHYKIGGFIPRFAKYLEHNINFLNFKKDSTIFNEGSEYTWGTTASILGNALKVILYKSSAKSNKFDSLLILQRDYILGRNAWGISFISGIGKLFPKHLHSQIAKFNNGYQPGALSAGAAPKLILDTYNLVHSDFSYSYFNSEDVEYYDDWNDFITNEATIFSNATALFIFGYFSSRE